jgi:hypothetical protein
MTFILVTIFILVEAIHYHKIVSGIFKKIMDIVHEHNNNGSGEPTPDILLARLILFKEMEEKWDTFSVKELLEMGLNCVHEAAHSLYIKHVYNGAVADTLLGDDLFWGRQNYSNRRKSGHRA